MLSDGDMPQVPPTRIYNMLLHTVADHSSIQNILKEEGVTRKTHSVTHANVLQTLRFRTSSLFIFDWRAPSAIYGISYKESLYDSYMVPLYMEFLWEI